MMNMDLFLTIKTIHILAIISWMAGILYLYRLFVYHFDKGQTSQDNHVLLGIMQKKLFRFITFPAMLVSITTGIILVLFSPHYLHQSWFQVKATCAFLLILTTFYCLRISRKLDQKQFAEFTSRHLRILNEVPTLLMIIIVSMAIFRPT